MAYMSSFPLYTGQNHIHYLSFIDSDLLYTGTLSGRFDKNIVWVGPPTLYIVTLNTNLTSDISFLKTNSY